MSLKTVPGFLFFTLLCAGCGDYSGYENRYNGNVAGTVYDRATGEPLQGVSIFYDYFENSFDTWNGTYYYYGDGVLDGITITDSEGKFLVRNLEEQKEHILVLRKWPGFDQEFHTITPSPFQTELLDFYLDSAEAEFRIDPLTLHYKAEEDRHYLVVINEGEIPIEWTMIEDLDWITSSNRTGIIASMEAEATYIELLRDEIKESIQDTIFIKVSSTGEVRPIPVSVEN